MTLKSSRDNVLLRRPEQRGGKRKRSVALLQRFLFAKLCELNQTVGLSSHRDRNLHSSMTDNVISKQHLILSILNFQERDLVLKRIAEDRRSQQERMQTSTATDTSPSSSQGQRLGGKVQTNVDNNCILMVRQWTNRICVSR